MNKKEALETIEDIKKIIDDAHKIMTDPDTPEYVFSEFARLALYTSVCLEEFFDNEGYPSNTDETIYN